MQMSDDPIRFPIEKTGLLQRGVRAQSATLESELDPGNPRADSLRVLLRDRHLLIAQYGRSDGSVMEKNAEIADRLNSLAGRE